MGEIQVTAERSIAAPADQVYRYIADYRDHHPRFLPPAFSRFHVEQGGVGAGTVVSFHMTAGGRSRAYRQRVAEPVPGRVLVETGTDSGEVTTFTVTPDGTASRVRIETRFDRSGGLIGYFERLLAPRLLRRLYADELERLDQYARQGTPAVTETAATSTPRRW